VHYPCKQITALYGTLNAATSSAMLYTVEPPLSVAEFTSATPSDLQVTGCCICVCGLFRVASCRYRSCGKL
jgi:hypothetical protein